MVDGKGMSNSGARAGDAVWVGPARLMGGGDGQWMADMTAGVRPWIRHRGQEPVVGNRGECGE